MAKVKFLRGAKADYTALATKQADTLYFCTDSGELYLGSTAMFDGETFKSVAVKKTTEGELDGKKLEFTKKDGSKFTLDVEEIINGGVIKLTGYSKAELVRQINANDSVNSAIGILEKKVDDAVAGGIQSITPGSGIAVDGTDDPNNPVVSVKIKDADKVLSADSNGLASTIGLSYDSDNRKIQLFGKDSENPISEIDAEAFIKDGVLYDQIIQNATGASMEVTFPKGDKNTFTGLTAGHTYLFLEFNDGLGKTTSKSYASCDMHGLVDVYTAGNGLQLGTGADDHKFSIKLDASNANGLSVGTNGLALEEASSDNAGALSAEDYDKIQDADEATEWGAF